MKKRSAWQTLLCLLLIACTALGLCACPGETPSIPPTPPEGDEEENVTYGNGNVIEGAGDNLQNSAVLIPASYDESKAQAIPTGNFFRIFDQYFRADSVIRANGNSAAILASNSAKDKSYNGKGAVLLMPQGIIIRGAENVTLSNLAIAGNITIEDSSTVIFENVEIKGEVSINAGTSDVVLNACRLTGTTTLTNEGKDVTLMNSYVGYTACGVLDSGKGTTVQNCRLEGEGTAIQSTGTDASFQYNTITVGEKAVGIAIGKGAVNAISAMNLITGTQTSVTVDGARNTVVVRNSLISVEAAGNRNLYVCDNEMGGRLIAKDNTYFLADNNTYPNDTYKHTAILENNENINGDTLTDVNARLEVGADKALLPHVDKYQFVGMERKQTIKEVTAKTESGIAQYVASHAAAGNTVIIAPGVYATDSPLSFGAEHANTTVYAYGVYVERKASPGVNSIGSMVTCEKTENVTIKGLSVGYAQPSVMQVYVLSKNEKNLTIDVLPGAGMIAEFGNSNPAYYLNMTLYLHPADNEYKPIGDIPFTAVSKLPDGKMRITLESASDFDVIESGDALTNRYPSYSRTIYTAKSKNITYQDLTVFGIAGAFCCYEEENESATTYYRMADTTRLGELITKTEYEKYAALEIEHGLDFEISQDESGHYYGSIPHIGSIDGIQADRCAQGSRVISCLFENMCDDGSLQKGRHARLAKITANGDGTATVILKGNHALNRSQNVEPDGFCADIKAGDTVAVYTAKGQLLCQSVAQDDAIYFDTVKSTYNGKSVKRYKVTVLEKDLNPEWETILSDYTQDANGYLTDDAQSSAQKILVDNMSRSCNGFLFDNVMVRNTRSRGFLIKASNGTIKNCTIRDNAKLAIAVIYEIYWGESGFSENVTIKNNLIDHVGYALHNNGQYLHYPINISGLGGGTVDQDHLLYQNIRITGNKFVNPVNDYWIYVQAAKGVVIENNDFGSFADEDDTHYTKILLLNGASDITLSDNRFSSFILYEELVEGEHYENIHGTDATLNGTPLIPDNP